MILPAYAHAGVASKSLAAQFTLRVALSSSGNPDIYLWLFYWPSTQVLHGERSLHNARGGWDLARFLADPDRDDVEAHLANLRCAPGPGRVVGGLCKGHGRASAGSAEGESCQARPLY